MTQISTKEKLDGETADWTGQVNTEQFQEGA